MSRNTLFAKAGLINWVINAILEICQWSWERRKK